MVLEKRKKFYAKSGTKRNLFRLRLRLLHAMLDVCFDNMLSSFCCCMTCLKWLRLLNEPLKKIMHCFYYMEAFYCGFLLDALFGLTWRMPTTCLTLTSRHKPLWWFGFWLMLPLYALFNDVLSLCMIMAVIALLVGRSQSLSWSLCMHPTPKNQVF
jgi:hypothetical protein